MACDARQVLVDGIGFRGLTTPAIKAVQIQLAAEALLALSPTTDVSIGAVLQRACANGFSKMTRKQLRTAIAQLVCDSKDALTS